MARYGTVCHEQSTAHAGSVGNLGNGRARRFHPACIGVEGKQGRLPSFHANHRIFTALPKVSSNIHFHALGENILGMQSNMAKLRIRRPSPSIAGQVTITPYRGSHNQPRAHCLRSRPDERWVTVMLVLRVGLVVHAPVCNMCVRCHAQARYPEFGLPLPAAQSVAFDNNCLHIYDSSEKSFPPPPPSNGRK